MSAAFGADLRPATATSTATKGIVTTAYPRLPSGWHRRLRAGRLKQRVSNLAQTFSDSGNTKTEGGRRMFMSIRRYRVDPGQRDEVVTMVDEGWADHLRNEPGFLSYHVVATAENELVSMTACQDEETLEKVIQKSGEWVGTHLSGLTVKLEDSRLGKVVSHLG
jgi:hypothetical protein